MTLILLALGLAIFVHDGIATSIAPGAAGLPLPILLAGVFIPKLALAAGYHLVCRRVLGRLGKPAASSAASDLRRLDHLTTAYRYLVAVLYGVDLFYLGLLDQIRRHLFDVVLVDELLVMAPTLAMLLWTWWAYYPIDRRLREANLIRRIDAGLPIYPIWTRWQYLLTQARQQMTLILAPMLAIMAWIEIVAMYVPAVGSSLPAQLQPWLSPAGVVVIFVLCPLLLRRLWDTVPLPEGEVRDRLTALCRRHHVRVRELLLWRTFGDMINAAVMGLFAPVRYILLTDGLLDMLSRDQVEAVMAHELAHVRRRHMFWMLLAAVATMGLLELAATPLLTYTAPPTSPAAHHAAVAGAGVWTAAAWSITPQLAAAGSVVVVGLGWFAVFGWFLRRVERQADAFAVQSLSQDQPAPLTDQAGRVLVSPEAVWVMVGALQQVADLNHIPPRRRSWRHGSIAWRQAYLRGLTGRPVDALPIDRQMGWLKLASLAAVAVLLMVWFGA